MWIESKLGKDNPLVFCFVLFLTYYSVEFQIKSSSNPCFRSTLLLSFSSYIEVLYRSKTIKKPDSLSIETDEYTHGTHDLFQRRQLSGFKQQPGEFIGHSVRDLSGNVFRHEEFNQVLPDCQNASFTCQQLVEFLDGYSDL